MAKFILLHLFLLLAGAESAEIWNRLIGGGPCKMTQRRHHVQVFQQIIDGERRRISICGGTLIHKNWVLTASHCYNKTQGAVSVKTGVHPKYFVHRLIMKKTFNIKSGDIHVYDETKKTGDIMLLKLPGAVRLINPAQLPASPCQTPANGEVLQVAGYGNTTYQNGSSNPNQPLQCLDLEVTDCLVPRTNFFCGEGLTGHPAAYVCKGDSGGGWLKRKGTRDVIYGVLRGDFKHCPTNSRFTSVCADPIRKWINDTMTNH